eukprot:scaffold3183_cov381-Prasinococcus_capsulatus_cf.AAC.19
MPPCRRSSSLRCGGSVATTSACNSQRRERGGRWGTDTAAAALRPYCSDRWCSCGSPSAARAEGTRWSRTRAAWGAERSCGAAAPRSWC